MKIRNGFVSNSSSSSFIVIGMSDLPSNVSYVELNDKQKSKILALIDSSDAKAKLTQDIINGNKVFLTAYCCCYHEINDNNTVYVFKYGDIDCPYVKEDYDEIARNIWFPKENI